MRSVRTLDLLITLFLLLMLNAIPAVDALSGPDRKIIWDQRIPVPKGAVISYTPEKETYILGEPIVVRFRLENKGDQPIDYRIGSDYRGASRSLRFMFIATDAAGGKVADPDPCQDAGGIGTCPDLEPGEHTDRHLILQGWCDFQKPGTYKVHAGQDIGWDPPVEELSNERWARSEGGTFSITLREPTEEERDQVLADLVSRTGKWDLHTAAQHFSYLRHPTYLQPLQRMLQTASDDPKLRYAALSGIGSIRNPEATASLIEHLKDTDRNVALAASYCLRERVPPVPTGVSPMGPVCAEIFKARRREMIDLCWREEFASRVIRQAKQMLESRDPRLVDQGAFFLRLFPDPESMRLLAKAVERYILELEAESGTWSIMDSFPKRAVESSLRALGPLMKAGQQLPFQKPDSAGEKVVWIEAVGTVGTFRPEGWGERYLALLADPKNVVRIHAVRKIPDDMADAASDRLAGLASDSDPEIRKAVFRVAARKQIRGLLPAALQAVAAETDTDILRDAVSACAVLEDTRHIDILIDRLTERDLASEIHGLLFCKTVPVRGGASDRKVWDEEDLQALQTAWREWFDGNREVLREVGRLPPDDPRLAPRPSAKGSSFRWK